MTAIRERVSLIIDQSSDGGPGDTYHQIPTPARQTGRSTVTVRISWNCTMNVREPSGLTVTSTVFSSVHDSSVSVVRAEKVSPSAETSRVALWAVRRTSVYVPAGISVAGTSVAATAPFPIDTVAVPEPFVTASHCCPFHSSTVSPVNVAVPVTLTG